MSVGECKDYIEEAVKLLEKASMDVRVVLTVSPIRYAKYGFHESALSKATLLLAAEQVEKELNNVTYFPAYEIVNDELRDYRFYQPDMLHPSQLFVQREIHPFGQFRRRPDADFCAVDLNGIAAIP